MQNYAYRIRIASEPGDKGVCPLITTLYRYIILEKPDFD